MKDVKDSVNYRCFAEQVAALALSALLFMFSWDYIMTHFFGIPEISYWQSFIGLYMIKVLGGSFNSSHYWQKRAIELDKKNPV